ncbi:MAG: hypothetical protein JWQ38_1981 [Flavipsychrobacter sp.]|nr:hypothetical protein [Flavipsychrobacter sp.]
MKKLTIICSFAFLIVGCAKKDTTVTTTPTSSTSTPSPNAGNVDGALISLKVDVSTSGYVVTTETALATFFLATGNSSNLGEAGTVSVNSYNLDRQNNNSYLKSASVGQTVTSLNFSSNDSKWVVSGLNTVPAFSYNHNVPFPTFTGSIPDAITRSNGVSVTFTGNVADADSVIIFIVKNNTSITRTFPASAASGAISASDLAGLPVVTDNSALMEVVPYHVTLNMQGSKKYAFIKERAVVKNININ